MGAKQRIFALGLTVGGVLGITASLLLALRTPIARANPGVLYVSATDPTCGGESPCYTSLQAAVNHASDGDGIRVAAGIYTGTQTIVASPGYTYTQVVLITKTLTIEGGYTTANWTAADPVANPTIIDAERSGRSISIVGDWTQAVTVKGLTITGGDYSGRGNPPGVANRVCARTGSDCGGGLFAHRVTLSLIDSVITDNISSLTTPYSDGGGAYLWQLSHGSRIDNTSFISNSTQASFGEGGGMYVDSGDAITISSSVFERNQAQGGGAGLTVFQPHERVLIQDTAFTSNMTSYGKGGALRAYLTSNGTALRLDRVTLVGNQGRDQGAAIDLSKQGSGVTTVDLTNVLLADNSLSPPGAYGAIVNAEGGSGGDLALHMKHLTWANHPTLTALRLSTVYGKPITATLTNSLVATATNAFAGDEGGGEVTVEHTKTLSYAVPTLHATENGTPTFDATDSLTGDPKLDADYHLQAGSAAINAGVDAGVTIDIDGDPRTGLPDIGADEYRITQVYLPLVTRNHP
jgi:hypothetical protein